MFPCWTPHLMVYWLVTSALTLVRNSRSDRYYFNRLKYWIENIFLNFKTSPACQNLSKAWLTSKSIDVPYCLSSNAWCMVWMILCVCCTVECWLLNANWCGGIQSSGFRSVFNLRSRSFSISSTNDGRSVGIVRLRTRGHGVCLSRSFWTASAV
jgi:hypothetical protein